MSHTQLVPRTHWKKYLQALSRRFHEQPVDLSLARAGSPARSIAHGLYFMGASLEGGAHPAVVLQFCRLGQPEAHYSHRVPAPTHLLREQDDAGDLDRLVLEDARHERTLLLFQPDAPSPGRHRLQAKLSPDNCDHPRCPLATA